MNKKILLIESREDLGANIKSRLDQEGLENLWVKDGPAGVRSLLEFKPDILVLDSELDGYSGYEVLERKKEILGLSEMAIIMISEKDYGVDEARAFNLGAKDSIIKADTEKVINKIRAYAPKENMNNENTGLEGKKILWVEDDAFLTDIISKKLSIQNLSLTHATSGEQAIELIEKGTPDVIMLDILLPGMSGLQLLEKIRQDDRWKTVPVIMLSNFAQKEDIEKAKSLGSAKFLVKATLTLDEIIAEIAPVLKS